MTSSKLRWKGFPHRHLPRIRTKDINNDSPSKKHEPHTAAKNVLRRSLSSQLQVARKQQRRLSGWRLSRNLRRAEEQKNRRAEKKKRKEVKNEGKKKSVQKQDSALWRWPSIEFSQEEDDRGSISPKSSDEQRPSSLHSIGKAGRRAWITGVIPESDVHSVQDAIRKSHHSETAWEHVVLDSGLGSTSQDSPTTILSFGDDKVPVSPHHT